MPKMTAHNRARARERLTVMIDEQTGILEGLVHQGEATPKDIILNLSDYLDPVIVGNYRNSPVFCAGIKKRIREAFGMDRGLDLVDDERGYPAAWDDEAPAFEDRPAQPAPDAGEVDRLRRQIADLERELLTVYRQLKRRNWR